MVDKPPPPAGTKPLPQKRRSHTSAQSRSGKVPQVRAVRLLKPYRASDEEDGEREFGEEGDGMVEGGERVPIVLELPVDMQGYRIIDSRGPDGINNAVSRKCTRPYTMKVKVWVFVSVRGKQEMCCFTTCSVKFVHSLLPVMPLSPTPVFLQPCSLHGQPVCTTSGQVPHQEHQSRHYSGGRRWSQEN